MKLYIVKLSKGNYDDYLSYVGGVFTHKNLAQEFIDNENFKAKEVKTITPVNEDGIVEDYDYYFKHKKDIDKYLQWHEPVIIECTLNQEIK